jgi:hypothetical protein
MSEVEHFFYNLRWRLPNIIADDRSMEQTTAYQTVLLRLRQRISMSRHWAIEFKNPGANAMQVSNFLNFN